MAQAEILRGRVEALPTTMVMVVAVFVVAGMMTAIVFGIAHAMGKV